MTNYIAFIDGTLGAYGAVFPDAPGCTAMGKTSDEVLANAAEALREWMADRVTDGLPPPEPRPYETLMKEAASDDVAPAAIALIPLLLDSGRSVRANISVDAGLLQAIDAAAKQRGLTRSSFIASAAREKIASRR
jgi:predicted RNase H-like HicB family nuclease